MWRSGEGSSCGCGEIDGMRRRYSRKYTGRQKGKVRRKVGDKRQ
jgi:hypothetical protein